MTDISQDQSTPTPSIDIEEHICPPGESWPEYDAQNIYLCRVCDACETLKLARYRPCILTGYDQSDVNEPIEGEY
jgi:hypothetical protein